MRRAILTASVLVIPRAALACPVCFGQNDSPMANAMNLGILAMLGIIVAVLGGFATFIIHLIRRERLAAQTFGVASTQATERLGLPGADPREGTAQC